MKRIITLTLTFLAINLYAINVEKMPRTIVQPDGTKIECFITPAAPDMQPSRQRLVLICNQHLLAKGFTIPILTKYNPKIEAKGSIILAETGFNLLFENF
jgi:hypothetical protein